MRQTTILKICDHIKEIQQLGMVVTGFYNVAIYDRRQAWQSTGKTPNYYQQYYALREHTLAKLLHSHVTQQILKTIENNYQSFFALKKNGHDTANPPSFRKPKTPSTFHFTNYGFKIIDQSHIELSTKNLFGKNILVKIESNPKIKINELTEPKILQFVFKKGSVTAHLVYEITTELKPKNDRTMAIDLGIKNFAVTYDTFRKAMIFKGGQILAISYYFDKKIAQLQSQLPKMKDGKQKHGSHAISRLHHQKNAQIRQILHSFSNAIVDYCANNDIRSVAIGKLTNLREGKDYGKKTNLKIHQWRYDQFTQMLKYKLEKEGIELIQVSERYTSRTCPECGDRKRKNRFTRGNYKCSKCGYENHSDKIGAMNILTMYQHGSLLPRCNSVVNHGTVINWASAQLICTEAPHFSGG